MSTVRSNKRKRERQKQRHASRTKQAAQQNVRIKTAGLISDLARPTLSPLAEAILQQQRT
jgi:hypothetical protein